jgi:hypothetical protein
MHVIKVDMDRKCVGCGKGGATGIDGKDGNFCMACIAKKLTGGDSVKITEEVLQMVAADIEGLLLENLEGISTSFRRISAGMKVSIGVALDHSAQGIVINYSVSYPLEVKPEAQLKETVKLKKTINFNQGDIFERENNP